MMYLIYMITYNKSIYGLFLSAAIAAQSTSNTSSTSSASVVNELQQFGIDGLSGLLQNPDQLAGLADIARCEECVGGAFVGAAGRAADAVDVVLRRVGVVVIDNELDILHVLKTGGLRTGVGVVIRRQERQTRVREKTSTPAEKSAAPSLQVL